MPRNLAIPAFCLMLVACGGDGINVYDVPKEAPPGRRDAALPAGHPPVGDGNRAGAPPSPSSGAGLRWSPPAGWEDRGASGMRAATYGLPGGAELTVVSLPGPSGGTLANVNRWRGQLGLAETDEAGLAKLSSRVPSPAGEVLVVEFPSKDGATRLIAGILAHRGTSWFFKATGPDAAVTAGRPAILAFLQGLAPGGGSR